MRSILLSVVVCLVASPALSAPDVGDVDHVGLTVSDLEKSTRFFTEYLGFKLEGRNDEYPATFVANGEVMVSLWQASGAAVGFDRKKNVGLHHLAFRVSSFEKLDALHHRLKSAEGVRIEFAPELFYGGPAKHMMVREPSGNRLEFIHRPPSSDP